MFFVSFLCRLKDKHGQKISFLVLFSFLIAFLSARIYALLYLFFNAPVINFRGVHVHHLNFGISFLAIAGFLSFYLFNTKWRNKVIILYGIGLGLTFDEFGMWLRLEDQYWMRASYDAIIVISVILINIVFFTDRWVGILKKISAAKNSLKRKTNSK